MPSHDEQDATIGGGHTDEVSTPSNGEASESAPSESTERVHHERRREQRKIDDFNDDRDPRQDDSETE